MKLNYNNAQSLSHWEDPKFPSCYGSVTYGMLEFISGCLQRVPFLTIMDLATYLVVSEGNITPATEYVKNTMITPPMKRASLTVTRKVFRI